MSWQTTHVQAAAAYLRERIAQGDSSVRTKAIYEGLLEVIDAGALAAATGRPASHFGHFARNSIGDEIMSRRRCRAWSDRLPA